MDLRRGHALDLIEQLEESPDLIVTDPPYAFGGSGDEHALSATVATVLRESARRLKSGGWMLVMCASSWRSTSYMVESVRGIAEPVRIATWCKPAARTKVKTHGWEWASVNVVAFKKGKPEKRHPAFSEGSIGLDHIIAAPVTKGRRAELPPEVAAWMLRPFAVLHGLMLDPFAGSGAILAAAEVFGMRAIGFELSPGIQQKHGGLVAAATSLLRYAESNECHHEDTHRGGAIWTICEDCGEKWADDRGGFKPYVEPSPISDMRCALDEASGSTD